MLTGGGERACTLRELAAFVHRQRVGEADVGATTESECWLHVHDDVAMTLNDVSRVSVRHEQAQAHTLDGRVRSTAVEPPAVVDVSDGGLTRWWRTRAAGGAELLRRIVASAVPPSAVCDPSRSQRRVYKGVRPIPPLQSRLDLGALLSAEGKRIGTVPRLVASELSAVIA
jgi:hypothetical protein